MKTFMRFLLFAIISLLTMISGSGKEDDKVLNKMTIAGNENSVHEYNSDYVPLEGL